MKESLNVTPRSVVFGVRLTPHEAQLLAELAAAFDLSRADYVRCLLLAQILVLNHKIAEANAARKSSC